MLNLKRKHWTRYSEPELKSVTYTYERCGIAIHVDFDELLNTYTITTVDLETYENDQRIQARGRFYNTKESITAILCKAEIIEHAHTHCF
jgi:hypothetical protein